MKISILLSMLFSLAKSLTVCINNAKSQRTKLVCYGTTLVASRKHKRVREDFINESVLLDESFFQLIEEKEESVSKVSTNKIFKEIGKANLLSQNQEIELGFKIQQLIMMDSMRDDLTVNLERVPSTTEWAEKCGYPTGQNEHFKEFYMECLQAKHMMVESNMRLVIAVAKKYSWMGIPLTDLVQEGSLGLIRAAEKFDPSRGFKFSTYASWWIQQAICKSLTHKSRTIRLPVHVHNILATVRRERKKFISELGRSPTNQELAYKTGMDPEKLQKYVTASRHALKMDVTPDKSNFVAREHIAEMLKAEDMQSPEDSPDFGEFRNELFNIVNDLSEDEKKVLILRFGFEDGLHRSISEVSAAMNNVSKSWVKRILLQSLRKIRTSNNNQKLMEISKSLQHMKLDSELSDW